MSEFDLIGRYFSDLGRQRDDVLLDVGDDCALLAPPAGYQLAISTDTLLAGRHFFADVDPESLGHKSLAVSLSDLAAMGAEPAWATLCLTLPAVNHAWLAGFSRGIHALALAHDLRIVGGDTTAGPLAISLQVIGLVRPERALRRDGARPGDRLVVSGQLGDAGLALRQLQAGQRPADALRRRLDWPEPRLALGRALAGRASAAIDISDGLLADLGHICQRSAVGAEIELARLPLSKPVAAAADWSLPLASGDDYELCFGWPGSDDELARLAAELDLPLTVIGRVRERPGIDCRLPDGRLWQAERAGFDHFDGDGQ